MEVIGACEAFDLGDSADVGAVRRRLTALAIQAGFDEARAGDAALIAAELGSNVLRHAGRGGAILGGVRDGDRHGVVIAAWDRGPGMNVEACLRDGMSTAGTRGAGLGAVARLATRFDAYSPGPVSAPGAPGRGSVVVATVFAAGRAAPSQFAIGGACMPYPGLPMCGDAWTAHVEGGRATLIGCDGLGHGDGAAAASSAVLAAFRTAPDGPLPAILERADRAARSTRGAAATVVRIDLARREVTVAGVGNVGAWIIGDVQKQLVTQHGTLGQAMPPRLREETHPLPRGALVVLCSDGIKSRWTLADHPGLISREPTTIATVVWRDFARGRDDASVIVAREATA